MVTRLIVLVYGPPGAGKTTYARTLDMPILDVDDPAWHSVPDCDGTAQGCGHELGMVRAIRTLGRLPHARAVVIRSAARHSSRQHWARMLGAEKWPASVLTIGLVPDRAVAISRVLDRNRPRPSIPRQIAAVHAWYARYEPDPAGIGNASRQW